MWLRTSVVSSMVGLLVSMAASSPVVGEEEVPSIRVATYNVSFYRDRQGQLIDDLERGDTRARSIAEVIQRVRPDILLLNEFDYDAEGKAAELFCERYLGESQSGQSPIEFEYRYWGPVNTGEPSGFDLDGDGKVEGPGDAFGWGRYPGQYGMLVLSRFPIAKDRVRSFQKLLWKDMPEAKLPVRPNETQPFLSDSAMSVFRISSKSHWDVPIEAKFGDKTHTLHLLCAHPTPPVFDGPEDRNGKRNHDEVRLWADYISGEKREYLVDDRGQQGGLDEESSFVIVGDLNADPVDGESNGGVIKQLLEHPRVNATVVPESEGAIVATAARPDLNAKHQAESRHDTADFSGDGQGNLRVDYVLPSRDLRVKKTAVFWPKPQTPGADAIRATDHRLVYADIVLGE